jgi:hypothetical protein
VCGVVGLLLDKSSHSGIAPDQRRCVYQSMLTVCLGFWRSGLEPDRSSRLETAIGSDTHIIPFSNSDQRPVPGITTKV